MISSRPLLALSALTALGLAGTCHADAVRPPTVAVVAPAPAAPQGLDGQAIHMDSLFTTQTHVFENNGTQTVTAAGTTFSAGLNTQHVTVKPNQITFQIGGGGRFHSAPFNGFGLSEAGSKPVVIVGVTIDPASPVQGLGSRLSFDSKHIFVNFQGLSAPKVTGLILDVQTK